MIAERPLLSVQGLMTRRDGDAGEAFPSRDVTIDVAPGELVGLVGESGAGKSTTVRAMIGLPQPRHVVEAGMPVWDGDGLARVPHGKLRAMRARDIALATRISDGALDPLRTIGVQLMRVHRRQTGSGRAAARAAALDILRRVGIADPEARLASYPDQLAAGARQRVMIALALICKPRLLIVDDALTGLDITAQAEILALLADCRSADGMAALVVSNDITVAARLCDRILVMYGGRIVESGPSESVIAAPRHPYTRLLLGAMPAGTRRDGPLPTLRGEPPDLAQLPVGCAFQPRCPQADLGCLGLQSLRLVAEDHRAACWRAAIASARARQ